MLALMQARLASTLGCWVAVCVPLLWPATGTAASAKSPPATPLEQAIAIYDSGEHAAAQQAFERLAKLGVPAADYNLAVMHIRRELPQASMQEAARLMTRAAERGFVTAMVGLARLHERGDIGGRRDLEAAHQWHLRAAQSGHAEAQVEAATGFYLGRGTAQDMGAAAHWYREAAKQGDIGAQYLIASMYEHGLGVPRDLRLARYWYEACADGGDVVAQGKLRELDAGRAPMPPH
jgi:TPR repeat protein